MLQKSKVVKIHESLKEGRAKQLVTPILSMFDNVEAIPIIGNEKLNAKLMELANILSTPISKVNQNLEKNMSAVLYQ